MTDLRALRIVDATTLDDARRDALRPDERLEDASGRARVLPRFFYEVPSWDAALDVSLAPHFKLWEFLQTDVREAEPLRFFPRYVPCAVATAAMVLEHLRDAVGATLRIAANGGYRSPSHALTRGASPHCWGTAVNLYRIGDTYLDSREQIEKYAALARTELPAANVRPIGEGPFADDHLHLDLGYLVAVPPEAPGADPGTVAIADAGRAETAAR